MSARKKERTSKNKHQSHKRGAFIYGRMLCSTALPIAERSRQPPKVHKKGSVVCMSGGGGVSEIAILTDKAPMTSPPVLEGARPCGIVESTSWSELDAINALLGPLETIEPALQISVRLLH